MTRHGITIMVEFAVLWPLATLAFQLARRKALVGGRFVGWRERPRAFWLWLMFDVAVLVLVWRLLEWVGRGRLWW
jgi:hypothetical protein